MLDAVQSLREMLNAETEKLNLVSQNLANINTPAYKRAMETRSQNFESLINSEPTTEVQTSIVKDFSQGALKYSGNSYDLAIEGQGFFLVEREGHKLLSRGGGFHVDNDGILKTKTGSALLGLLGSIRLDPKSFIIDSDGKVYQDEIFIDKIKIVDFKGDPNIQYIGSGEYSLNQNSNYVDIETSLVKQGYRESSNVRSMDEMIKLIEITRHFETGHQILKGYDEIIGTAINNLGDF